MNGFLAELKRRKVFHTAAVYAVVALGVSEGTQIVVGQLGLPDAVATAVVVAALLGFPVALVLAWFFEVRPEEPAPAVGGAASEAVEEPASPRRRWGLVVAAVAAVAVVSATLVVARPGGLSGAVLSEGALVLIAEFTASEENSELALAVRSLVRTALEQSPHVRVVTPGAVQDALGRMELPEGSWLTPEVAREIGVRDGYAAVVEGEVARAGAGWLVSVRIVAPSDGAVLVSDAETIASDAEVPEGVQRLVERVRAAAGESLQTIEGGAALPELTTGSLPALMAMERAWRARETGEGDALVHIQEALELDSTFIAAKTHWAIRMAPNPDRRAEAGRMLQEVYPERYRLAGGERADLEWTYHEFVTGDVAAGIAAIRQHVEERPDALPDHQWQLALSAMFERDWPRAEALLRPIDDGGGMTFNLNAVLAVQGKFGELRQRLDQGQTGGWRAVLRVPLLQENWGEFERIGRANQAEYNLNEPYLLEMIPGLGRGQVGATEAAIDAWEQDVLGAGHPLAKEWRVRFLAMADVLLRGDSAGALRRARALPEPHASDLRLALAELFAVAGRATEARALLQRYDETTDTLTKIGLRTDRGSTEGRVLFSEGDPQAAIRTLRRVGDSSFGWSTQCSHCYLAIMGEAYEALDMPDSAAVKYEAFLGTYWMFSDFRFWRIPWLGTVHERLGALYEELGRPEDAVRHYRKLAEDWTAADPELQPRVEAAREALRRLGATEGP